MIVVGLNAYHGDAAAALVRDGVVVAAVEEERFTRIKHWAGMPVNAIRCCLEIAGVSASEVDRWAINSDSRAHRLKKLAYLARGGGSFRLIRSRLGNRSRRRGIDDLLAEAFDGSPGDYAVQPIEHHLSHLASAFYPSGFDRALAVSIDGFGDFSSVAWATAGAAPLEAAGFNHFPHSLGVFYQAVTQYLGFPAYGDEYKMMGLASYGAPDHVDALSSVVRVNRTASGPSLELDLGYFRHHNEAITFSFDDGAPAFSNLFSARLEDLLGPARVPGSELTDRHRNIAASAQAVYEGCLFDILNQLHDRSGEARLTLAGGCAMNSVANGKIRANTRFESVYVQPAAGDAGGAIGAALAVSPPAPGVVTMRDAYLGPSFNDEIIESLLSEHRDALASAGCQVSRVTEARLVDTVVANLTRGNVIGWFQGRMEWGARALGNRSILGDPRRDDMQDILNRKIKRRESFRPFAPSVLREAVAEWFEEDDDVPHMQKVLPIRTDKRGLIPAVTHVDGTGRLQTVTARDNPRYHRLISTFAADTGVPMLLNTSFNENEPIVCQPREALDCFLRTRMDVLAMGNWLIERSE